jgi:sulfatase modifying factor 1
VSAAERRPDEDQVEVTLSKGFWTAKYETTQGQWKRIVGKLPGKFTAELPDDDDWWIRPMDRRHMGLAN